MAPAWWPASTMTRPAIDRPIRTAYSTRAMPTCTRAVSLIPMMAIMSMTQDEADVDAEGLPCVG